MHLPYISTRSAVTTSIMSPSQPKAVPLRRRPAALACIDRTLLYSHGSLNRFTLSLGHCQFVAGRYGCEYSHTSTARPGDPEERGQWESRHSVAAQDNRVLVLGCRWYVSTGSLAE